MQGGATHPADGYPAGCEAYFARTPQHHEPEPTPQMDLFSPASYPFTPPTANPVTTQRCETA